MTASAFDEFFALNCARTVRLAHLLTGVDAVAEDLAQESFARLHPRFGDVANPSAYLHTVCVNVCRSWHKRNFRDAAAWDLASAAEGAVPGDPEHLLEMVDGLPFRQRAVLVLRYWLDLPERDIAAAIGCRPSTVRTLHFRALAALRKEFPR
jgi:DNA-directed RNA polymerase specialized sigma24 family protein